MNHRTKIFFFFLGGGGEPTNLQTLESHKGGAYGLIQSTKVRGKSCGKSCCCHRRGNDFSLGEQKLVKNNQDNHTQSIALCSMYFWKKKNTQCIMGSRAKPQKHAKEFSRIFVLKVTVCKVTSKLQKKLGSRMY